MNGLTFRELCPDLAGILDEVDHHDVDPAGIEAFTKEWQASVGKLAPTQRTLIVFEEDSDFCALNSCRSFLDSCGFSIASIQRGAPCGVLEGDYLIAKWKNLTIAERKALHATVTGDNRNGPLTLTILPACPPDAAERLRAADKARHVNG